jgi:hypothetical protein
MPMTRTTTPALLTTPAEAAYCATCESAGTRHAGDRLGSTFPHCPVCGSTDLADTRSIFEVLHEARALLLEAELLEADPYRIMGRRDDVAALELIAAGTDPTHCGDCATWARTVGWGR